MTTRRLSGLGSLAVLTGLLAGCSLLSLPGSSAEDASGVGVGDEGEWNDWVVVHFGDSTTPFPEAGDTAMIPTELAAATALEAAGIGSIDGNEWGDYSYDLYFFGSDRERMWEVLESVLEDAPAAWTSVDLMRGLDDANPVVLHPQS